MSQFLNDPEFAELWNKCIDYLLEDHGILHTEQEANSKLINFELAWKGDIYSAKDALRLTMNRGETRLIIPTSNEFI